MDTPLLAQVQPIGLRECLYILFVKTGQPAGDYTSTTKRKPRNGLTENVDILTSAIVTSVVTARRGFARAFASTHPFLGIR